MLGKVVEPMNSGGKNNVSTSRGTAGGKPQNPEPIREPDTDVFKRQQDVFKAYEDGKHRRYSLLFAVNGGAFAIAKLINPGSTDPEPLNLLELPQLFTPNPPETVPVVLGQLNLGLLSLGMALFTTVMVLDIFMFGQNMRHEMEILQQEGKTKLFDWPGKLVLTLIGLLISAGWILVSFDVFVLAVVVLVYLPGLVYALIELWKALIEL